MRSSVICHPRTTIAGVCEQEDRRDLETQVMAAAERAAMLRLRGLMRHHAQFDACLIVQRKAVDRLARTSRNEL
jgi:hypothetical protein